MSKRHRQSKTLFDDDVDVSFQVNERFAKDYQRRKEGEELSKLKEEYRNYIRSEVRDESSSSHELEDDIGILADDYEEDFLALLPRISMRDPSLKGKEDPLFKEIEYSSEEDIVEEKPMHYKDVFRETLIGNLKEDKDDSDEDLPLAQQREKARDQFLEAAFGDEDSDEDFFTIKKTQEQIDAEVKKRKKFVKGDDMIKDYWLNSEGKTKEDKFLIDYILNKRWLSTEDEEDYNIDELLEIQDLIFNDKAEQFEAQYNFRHEEPTGTEIQHFSRNQESVRKSKKKESRKKKREAKKEKELEKKRKVDKDILRMKKLQKKKIEERLKSIQKITGLDDEIMSKVMEEDFDPDNYDHGMENVFDDEFYEQEEYEKPQFEYDEFIDDEFLGEYEPEKEDVSSLVDQVIQDNKFDATLAEDKELNKYIDEYYQLDYEDIVGGQPVRFKYTKVPAYDYGLSTDEILKKSDKELNNVIPLKRLNPYRDDGGRPMKKKKYYHRR
eukprot:TRINITY_DN3170_c0_g1_i4.p1 TRINITY_DN3170_c0_g1~~TRINITY_DN3170_c0_g1_i4.p1  ORF type:complete len:511 (+),score=177.74 TRINITY_DN3170_c0_g1_i4:47-1534(+)